jgi:D-arginine dehydrogenase
MKIIVIGGGIAGISIAAELSRTHQVTLLEMEQQLAHHTTGRSAAMYLGSYGDANVQALTGTSLDIYNELSHEYGYPLLTPREMVQILDHHQLNELDETLTKHPAMKIISVDDLMKMTPYINRDIVGAVLRDTSGYDIDVAGLHQTYVRRFTANGGVIEKSHEVTDITFDSIGTSTVRTPSQTFHADLIVNAAGAWGNYIAERAQCPTIPLEPLRRTIFISKLSQAFEPGPMVLRHPEEFYFRVDRGTVLGSPADETPSVPCDAQPEEIDVAMAIGAINEFTTLNIRSVESTWAGLRTFTSDRSPAMGSNSDQSNFFWFCGQGGYGIQMAPKLAVLATDVINNNVKAADANLVSALSPRRFSPHL